MWLINKKIDIAFLFAPVWAIWVVLFFLPSEILQAPLPLWIWITIVIGIDVSHVWSTIFRTYLDKKEFAIHRQKLIWVPIISLVILLPLASEAPSFFWTVLAYLAVFHFMKQQYGFLALYTLQAKLKKQHRWFKDKTTIYLGMIYPVVYWHFTPRNFEWFVSNDFFAMPAWNVTVFFQIANLAYWAFILGWLVEEIYLMVTHRNSLSMGRLLWMLSTALNWYIGIVWFNSDLAFTLTNVVAHGIPYFTLVIYYQFSKKPAAPKSRKPTWLKWSLFVVIGSLLFALTEEFFWETIVNNDYPQFLMQWRSLFEISDKVQLAFLAILTVPQMTHYILDGYIWKLNNENPDLKKLFGKS